MTAIWWIRRDQRLHDNLTLQAALQRGTVIPLFVFDPHFDNVPTRRRGFLVGNLKALDADSAVVYHNIDLHMIPPLKCAFRLAQHAAFVTLTPEVH